MGKVPTIEIQVCESELNVYPSIKALNGEKYSGCLFEQLEAALNEPREQVLTSVVVDLGEIAWISSAGLNELIRIRGLSRTANVEIHLRSANETVREVFRITRLERIFALDEDSADSAIGDSRVESPSKDLGGTEAVASL